MLTQNFEELLKSIRVDSNQIELIANYLLAHKGRVNADSIEYGDGSVYYSEGYVKEMMDRSHSHGRSEGQRQPVIHKAEIVAMSCPTCGWVQKD